MHTYKGRRTKIIYIGNSIMPGLRLSAFICIIIMALNTIGKEHKNWFSETKIKKNRRDDWTSQINIEMKTDWMLWEIDQKPEKKWRR